MISWALIESENGEHESIPIDRAKKRQGQVFICPECFGELFIKKGLFRTAHFSHYVEDRDCRLRQRSYGVGRLHLQLQEHLYTLIEGEKAIEYVFTELKRRADLVDFSTKTVYEIQASPIRPSLALQRTADYWKNGWKVIWILCDSYFHPRVLSELQQAFIAAGIPYYYARRRPSIAIFDALYDDRKRDSKCIQTLQIQSLSQEPLPWRRLAEWLLYYNASNIDRPQETLFLRRELWPYSLKGDILSQAESESAPKNRPANPSALKDAQEYIFQIMPKKLHKRWVEFLARL